MSKTKKIYQLTQTLLPEGLKTVRKQLENPAGVLFGAAPTPAPDSGGFESVGMGMPPKPEPQGELPALTEAIEPLRVEAQNQVLALAASGLDKLEAHGENADLSSAEADAFEAIVLMTGRPALFIQNGKFFPPSDSHWAILEGFRKPVEETILSVGRIEVTGHPSLPWVGTGWVIAPEVIITNRHVAKEFCRMKTNGKWEFEPGMTARIDFHEELSSEQAFEFAITEVIGVHDQLDFALFRIASAATVSGLPAPNPLKIAKQSPAPLEKRNVYVLGYPAWDGRRNDPDVMMRIFAGVFNIKRLQPGEIMQLLQPQSVLQHDCSTLGGNSGSVVLDLETQQVLGLHYSGFFGQFNQAIPLWLLQQDPLIQQAGITFE